MRGLYVAGTGLINRSQQLDVTGNNLSNLSTPGYKKEGLVSASFGEYMTLRESGGQAQQVGATTHGVIAAEGFTDHSQGAVEQTGSELHLAIAGEGFFTLRTANGGQALTRNGQFVVDADGNLADGAGNLVLGTQGPVNIAGADFAVNGEGQVFIDGVYSDTLRITRPADANALVKQEGSLYTYAQQGGLLPFEGQIRQGALERANVEITTEMSSMIENSRAYQSCSQIIRMMDQILEKTVTELGSL